MDMHKNARLTAHCRALVVDRDLKGPSKRQVACQFDVSIQTVNKWLRRHRKPLPQQYKFACLNLLYTVQSKCTLK